MNQLLSLDLFVIVRVLKTYTRYYCIKVEATSTELFCWNGDDKFHFLNMTILCLQECKTVAYLIHYFNFNLEVCQVLLAHSILQMKFSHSVWTGSVVSYVTGGQRGSLFLKIYFEKFQVWFPFFILFLLFVFLLEIQKSCWYEDYFMFNRNLQFLQCKLLHWSLQSFPIWLSIVLS